METAHIFDRNGDSITVQKRDGGLYPLQVKSAIEIETFSARPDDVFVCSYCRSGTHWTWEILGILLTNDLRLQTVSKQKFTLEMLDCDDLDSRKSPRVISTHLNYHLLPSDIFEKRCKVLLVCRNPKDLVVSFYSVVSSMCLLNYSGQFEAFLELFEKGNVPYGSWFEYMREWDEVIKTGSACPIMVVYYEQLKKHFRSTVKDISAFLQVSRSEEFFDELERLTSFECMKNSKEEHYNQLSPNGWKGSLGILRKGEVGDWKNWFTVAQNEHFEEHCKQQLKGTMFSICFSQ